MPPRKETTWQLKWETIYCTIGTVQLAAVMMPLLTVFNHMPPPDVLDGTLPGRHYMSKGTVQRGQYSVVDEHTIVCGPILASY